MNKEELINLIKQRISEIVESKNLTKEYQDYYKLIAQDIIDYIERKEDE